MFNTAISDLFWIGEKNGQLPPAGVNSIYVGNNEVARATFNNDLVGGKTYRGHFEGALDGRGLVQAAGFQVEVSTRLKRIRNIFFTKNIAYTLDFLCIASTKNVQHILNGDYCRLQGKMTYTTSLQLKLHLNSLHPC